MLLIVHVVLVLQLVVISDPHIKVDPDWSLYCEARDGGHFVKNREGRIYQGSCWPGNVLKINLFYEYYISDQLHIQDPSCC